MVYVSADIQTLFLSHGTLLTLGVLSRSFPSLREHANAETQECAGQPAAITNAHNTRTCHWWLRLTGRSKSFLHLPSTYRRATTPRSLTFRCTPENNNRMKTWLLDRYASSIFNTCFLIALFIAWRDHPSKSMSAPQ